MNDFSLELARIAARPRQNEIITVGGAGQYSTINAALDVLGNRMPSYLSNGYEIELRLLSGFVMAEQVLLRGVDLSWITLTSEDTEVVIHRVALSQNFAGTWQVDVGGGSADDSRPAFGAVAGARLPKIGALFRMNSSGTSSGNRHGARLHDRSQATFLPGAGILDAGGNGVLLTEGCDLVARGALFDGAERSAVWGRLGCRVDFYGGFGRNTGWTSFALHSSYGDCEEATLTGAGHYGIRCRRGSVINAESCNFSNANEHGVNVNEASVLNIRNAVGTNCGEYGIQCTEGSRVEARSVNLTGSGWDAIRCAAGSYVDFYQGVANAQLTVQWGSIIAANSSAGSLSQAANTPTASGVIFR